MAVASEALMQAIVFGQRRLRLRLRRDAARSGGLGPFLARDAICYVSAMTRSSLQQPSRAVVVVVAAVAALAALACAAQRYAIRADVQPAPVDAEVERVPNIRGFWMSDAEYGGKIYVIVAGVHAASRDVPTLVMVHGLGDAGVKDFYPLLPALTRDRRVVTFDLPGFGRSGRANEKYTPERYARVVSEVIAAFADGPVDVMGHSMGGAIALLHAATYPSQVHRLIVADAAGILHREAWFGQHLRRVTDPAGKVVPRVAVAMADVAAAVMDATRVLGAAPDVILAVPLLRQKILRGEPGRIAALSLILYDFGPALSRISAPTLIAWGENDNVAPLRTGQLLADRVHDAKLVVIAGAGHDVMAEAPQPLLAEIERHLGVAPTALPAAGVWASSGGAGSSQGAAVCNGSADMKFKGVYDSLVIEGCTDARLDDVRARRLVLRRSTASIVHSTFSDGIVADASTLIMTGGGIDGPVAIDVNDSRLDLAGVAIETSGEPYRVTGESRVLFSVCSVRTPRGVGYRHGFLSNAYGPTDGT
jgi:pimeloyl-ACP methyl ester carboxylesterase